MTAALSLAPEVPAAAALRGAKRARRAADQAEREVLIHAAQWAAAHEVAEADRDRVSTFGDSPVPLGGEGVPQVSHFAVLEFGTEIGLTKRAAEQLFAEVLELGHRLPRTWALILNGVLKAWKARHIANATHALSPQAADWVDTQVAFCASRISAAELQRLIDTAIATFMPAYANDLAEQAEHSQHLAIDLDQVSFTGTAFVHGELDLPDAIDLEEAVRADAQRQKDLGSELSLQARRAKALGNLARGDYVFDYNSALPEPDQAAPPVPTVPTALSPQAIVYFHLDQHSAIGTAQVQGKHLLTLDQIKEWIGRAEQVSFRPVIDLGAEITCPGYEPSAELREQVMLRDRTCVFAHCTRSARACDLDHIQPYNPHGSPGQATTSNLACLCRTHHRMKTFARWSYEMIAPGIYRWRSPNGSHFLRDRTGTQELDPPDGPSG